jgi:predicted RNA-binding Zn ribbon-like protein
MATSSPDSFPTNLAFLYVGGDPALDLVNTVDYTERGLEDERLTDYDRLTRWAEGAGILSPNAAASLRTKAEARPREAEAAYKTALRARAVLGRLFGAIAREEPAGKAVGEFNRLLGRALEQMRVMPSETRRRPQAMKLGWGDPGERLDSIVWPVLWSAASLLVSEEAGRIRVCGGPDCGWMYVDRSRNGLRRWCQMATCGTREKSRRRYQRIKTPRRARGRRRGSP